MTRRRKLRPGDVGYLDAIPPFDAGLPATNPDGTVDAADAPVTVLLADAIAIADTETQRRLALVVHDLAVQRRVMLAPPIRALDVVTQTAARDRDAD